MTEEIGAPLISDFLREFQATQRALCNAAGFSNPLQKAVFNLSYGSRFSKEYRRLRPIITNFWQDASANELMPIESLAVVMCMKIKGEINIKIEDEDDLQGIVICLNDFFENIRVILGAKKLHGA